MSEKKILRAIIDYQGGLLSIRHVNDRSILYASVNTDLSNNALDVSRLISSLDGVGEIQEADEIELTVVDDTSLGMLAKALSDMLKEGRQGLKVTIPVID